MGWGLAFVSFNAPSGMLNAVVPLILRTQIREISTLKLNQLISKLILAFFDDFGLMIFATDGFLL